MKNVLITGISRGLGAALSKFLSHHGCTIYGTVRKPENFKDSEFVKHFYLDLQDKESIEKAASSILQAAGHIDVIIHNSGIAYLEPTDVMSDKERRHVFDVNFFGPIYLTEQLLPSFRTANRGNLIFISSIVSVDHWPSLGVYSASKAAIECVAFEWAVLLKKWNIDVSIIRANPLPTDMQIQRSSNTKPNPYERDTFCNELLWEKVEDICETVLKIICFGSDKHEYTSGPLSRHTIDSILKKNAYEKLLKKYRKKLKID